jgi:hypothetical protein
MLLLLCAAHRNACAQTTITIVGTVHNATPAFTRHDFYQILENGKPDLVLFEFDSTLMGKDMKFNKQFLDIFEVSVVDSFLKIHPNVLVRPFDIEGRNDFFSKANYFTLEMKMFNEIMRLYNADSLPPAYMLVNKKALELSEAVNKYASQSAMVINSKEADDAVEGKMKWYHGNFPEMIKNTASLQQYEKHMIDDSTFWQKRNKAMAEHIVQYATLFKDKRILVITGYYHRYFLKQLLFPLQEKFRLKEFYEK